MTAPLPHVDPSELVIELTPMRRRHLRSVLRIEAHNPHRPCATGRAAAIGAAARTTQTAQTGDG